MKLVALTVVLVLSLSTFVVHGDKSANLQAGKDLFHEVYDVHGFSKGLTVDEVGELFGMAPNAHFNIPTLGLNGALLGQILVPFKAGGLTIVASTPFTVPYFNADASEMMYVSHVTLEQGAPSPPCAYIERRFIKIHIDAAQSPTWVGLSETTSTPGCVLQCNCVPDARWVAYAGVGKAVVETFYRMQQDMAQTATLAEANALLTKTLATLFAPDANAYGWGPPMHGIEPMVETFSVFAARGMYIAYDVVEVHAYDSNTVRAHVRVSITGCGRVYVVDHLNEIDFNADGLITTWNVFLPENVAPKEAAFECALSLPANQGSKDEL